MESKQFDARNLAMVMDFYEMTMSNGYFEHWKRDGAAKTARVAFDVFYRKNPDNGGFAIFAGLEQVLDYIETLHFDKEDIDYLRSQELFSEEFLDYLGSFHFTGDVYSFPEGTIMYPNEPVLTVVAPLIDAQLIETAILLQINHQSLIATKARRIVQAADGRLVSDFGARRAHNMDAAVYGARAAYLGGAAGTATVLAGQMFNIPVSGTMAHSWVMYFEDEYTAFKKYAETYPDAAVLLVDTYDVLGSGIPNAIRTAKEVLEPMGKRLKGIRLDSGDLAYLSKKARKMLDAAELSDCKIVITAKSDPVFGAVYKLVAVEKDGSFAPRIKVSENAEKITNPGLKQVYRVYDENGKSVADLIACADEEVDLTKPYRYIDQTKPWAVRYFKNCTCKKLLIKVMENGRTIGERKTIAKIREYVEKQLADEIWAEEQRFENPHIHYMDMSPALYELKMEMLTSFRQG